jgi:hypothetical protein
MGATVSVINEEMARPLDGADIQPTSSVQMADVKRLRELLHVVYKDEDDIDDSALTPSLALEIDALMSKCANEPGLGRLANDELLRQLLMERVEELSPSEREAHNNTLQNNNNDESKTDEPKKKKKLDIASLARLHAQKTRLGNVQNTTSNKVNADEAVTPIASSNSSNFNPLQFPDHLPEGGGGSGSDSLNNALTPTGSHAHHHLHRSPSSNSNRLPMVVEKQYSFTEDNLMDSISSSKSRLSMNKSGSMNEADLEEEAAALIASYKKREEESKDMLNNGSLELMEELAELPMATLPSQQTEEYLKQQQQQQQQAQLQDKTQAEPTVMKGRSRPALLTFDIQDDNTAAAAATTPQAVTGGGGGRRRKKMSLALTLDPENDLTSSTPMKEYSPKRNNNPGLELNIFGGGNEDTSAQLHAHHHHHASHHQLQNGHGGGQGGSAQGQGGNPNYNISEDVDGCQLSKSGTLMVDDFRISVDGIVESPTGQFGATPPGFNNLNGLNITDAKSPNSVGTENGSLGDFDGSMQNVDPSLRRPSKMKRRPSLNKSSHAGATGEPFLELQRLGAGASGTVVKALHVETLRLVAIKTLPIYDAAKRHQMICELKLLYRWQMESITLPIHHNQSSMEAGQNALSGNDSDDDEDTNKKEEKKRRRGGRRRNISFSLL